MKVAALPLVAAEAMAAVMVPKLGDHGGFRARLCDSMEMRLRWQLRCHGG